MPAPPAADFSSGSGNVIMVLEGKSRVYRASEQPVTWTRSGTLVAHLSRTPEVLPCRETSRTFASTPRTDARLSKTRGLELRAGNIRSMRRINRRAAKLRFARVNNKCTNFLTLTWSSCRGRRGGRDAVGEGESSRHRDGVATFVRGANFGRE